MPNRRLSVDMAVDERSQQCPPTPPHLPREPTPDRLKLSPSGRPASRSSSGRCSPETPCPICLGRLDNKSFTDGCMHTFCFICILEWAKVRAVCPLCKNSFTSIIHSVRSDLDYKRYQLPPESDTTTDHLGVTASSNFLPPGGVLMSSSSSSSWNRRHHDRIRSLVAPLLWPGSLPVVFGDDFDADQSVDYRLPSMPTMSNARRSNGIGGGRRTRVTWRRRRQVYLDDMWALPSADQLTGRYRETGPEFYRANPACTHRLVPWLNRELTAVLSDCSQLAYLLDMILSMITRVHILSSQLRRRLSSTLHVWTEHFVHELYTYARSPYDMIGYDLNVQYERGRPLESFSTVVLDDSSSGAGDDDSDRPSAGQWPSGDDAAEGAIGGRRSDDSDVQVIAPSSPLSSAGEGRRPDGAPMPGPSGLQATLDQVRSFLATVTAGTVSDQSQRASALADSDGDVQVLDVLPPRTQRAPLISLLTSDSSGGSDWSPRVSEGRKHRRRQRSKRRQHKDGGGGGDESREKRRLRQKSTQRSERSHRRDRAGSAGSEQTTSRHSAAIATSDRDKRNERSPVHGDVGGDSSPESAVHSDIRHDRRARVYRQHGRKRMRRREARRLSSSTEHGTADDQLSESFHHLAGTVPSSESAVPEVSTAGHPVALGVPSSSGSATGRVRPVMAPSSSDSESTPARSVRSCVVLPSHHKSRKKLRRRLVRPSQSSIVHASD